MSSKSLGTMTVDLKANTSEFESGMDKAARTGMSLTSAAETIGRALDVPSQGLSALSRQGFRFTEEQKELVKFLEDTGRASEAQGIILEALSESYDGAAQSARDTFAGSLGAVKNSLNDLMTGDGASFEGAKNSLNDLNSALQSAEIKAVWAQVIEAVSSALATFIKNSDIVLNCLDFLKRSIATLTSAVQGLGASFLKLAIDFTPFGWTAKAGAQISDFVGITDNASKSIAHFSKQLSRFSKEAVVAIPDIWSGDFAGTELFKKTEEQTKQLNSAKEKSIKLNTQELEALDILPS